MDTLNKTCANFPQSRDLTAAVEQSFLAVKDLLRLVLDPLTQPLSWLLEINTNNVLMLLHGVLLSPFLMAIVYYASKSLKLVSLVLIWHQLFSRYRPLQSRYSNTCYYFRLCILCVLFGVSNWYCYVP